MTGQHVLVALAVLAAVVYLARVLVGTWRAARCPSGGCSGCPGASAGCRPDEQLVQLGRGRGQPPVGD